jgi:MFS family permease
MTATQVEANAGNVTPAGEFKNGWPVVLSSAIGIGMGLSPLPFYTIGVFVGPMSQPIAQGGLGFTPGQIMLALPIYTLGALFMSPIIGFMADRVGVRKVALASIVLFALSLMGLGLNNGSFPLYAATWAIMAIAGAGTLPITFTRAVNNWFFEKRGLALGIALIATGLFGTLAKLLAQEVTTLANWRVGYAAVALMPLLISFPIALVGFRDIIDSPAAKSRVASLKTPLIIVAVLASIAMSAAGLAFVVPELSAKGPRPELLAALVFAIAGPVPAIMMLFGDVGGTSYQGGSAASKAAAGLGLNAKQALTDWRFWLLAIAFVPISYAIGGPIPNLELSLGAKGFSKSDAVALASLMGVAVIAGRLVGGYLIDRFWAPGIAFVFLAMPAIALWMLGAPELSRNGAMIAIFMVGFGAGVEYDFMAYLVARYFGTKAYGAIYGMLYGFFALGAGFGPKVFADAIRQGPEQAATAFHNAAITLIVASALLLLLGKYRSFQAEPEASSG